jgi:hypothetical protein
LKYLITILTILVALQILLINNELKKIHSLYEFTPVEFTPLPKQKVLGITIKIADAIKQVESRGNYKAKGLSGEYGAYQFLPSTFNSLSKKYLGKIVPMTPENQREVAILVIDDMVKKGYTKEQIALWWNSGQTKRCSAGINRFGVKFDSCAYVQKVVANIK